MNQLIPCPGCNRHVRQAESSCPFCSAALSLADVPEHALPRTRLGRAATFAFGATLVGATALVACGGESEEGKKGGDGGMAAGGTSSKAGSASGGTSSKAGSASGGSSAGTQSIGGTGIGPVYGAPAGGTFNDGGSNGSAGSTTGGAGAPGTVYGAPAAGSGNMGGFTGIPVYGSAPAD